MVRSRHPSARIPRVAAISYRIGRLQSWHPARSLNSTTPPRSQPPEVLLVLHADRSVELSSRSSLDWAFMRRQCRLLVNCDHSLAPLTRRGPTGTPRQPLIIFRSCEDALFAALVWKPEMPLQHRASSACVRMKPILGEASSDCGAACLRPQRSTRRNLHHRRSEGDHSLHSAYIANVVTCFRRR